MPKAQTFDAIIIGSGMTGGTAARELCRAGLKVLVLEAGPPQPQLSADNGHHTQNRCYAFSENTRQYFVNDRDHPYFTPPNQPFSWIRARALGGRSMLWAGHCYRMTDLEFLAANEDGVGVNWPITSEEIAPYYDKAESILGVTDRTFFGGSEGANQRAHDEKHFGEAFSKFGPRLIRARLSRMGPHGDAKVPCLHCGRIAANCSRPAASPNTTLAEALKTGRLTIWTQSPVSHITADGNGSPTLVCGVDQKTGQEFAVKGRLIFLCASTLESTRILLNSRSSRFPDGLANSSGVLGHYLMDHVSGIVVTGSFDRPNGPSNVDCGAGMFYVPRWQHLGGHRSDRFLRGYGYQMFTLPADHELLPCGGTQRRLPEPSGNASGNATVRLVGFGEMLPRYENFVEINKEGRKDACGIPVLTIHCKLGDNEQEMAKQMLSSAQEMLESAGVHVDHVQGVPSEPGLAIHEAGTCRMGIDPKTSVLNAFNQCHDAPNIFVTDGSSFPSVGVQNPVLTMVALTIRACDYAVEQLRKSEL